MLSCSTAFAADTAPSEASVLELIQVTGAKKLADAMPAQIEDIMASSMKQAIGDRPMTPSQQAVINRMQAQVSAIMRDEISWDKIEPIYYKVYRDTFTQEEIDGLIAFYKSPAGVAFVKKMPRVMQETMTAMQERMGPIMRRVQAAIQESAAEINSGASPSTDSHLPDAPSAQ